MNAVFYQQIYNIYSVYHQALHGILIAVSISNI